MRLAAVTGLFLILGDCGVWGSRQVLGLKGVVYTGFWLVHGLGVGVPCLALLQLPVAVSRSCPCIPGVRHGTLLPSERPPFA